MLEEKLVYMSLFLQLISQPALPSKQLILQSQNKNPVVYAQASENDSIIKLLEKAESHASTNPEYAADLYIEIIASGNPIREMAIESVLSVYEKLLAKSNSKPIVDSALRVLNHVVEGYENRKENSKHLDRVYLISGIIICCRAENKDVEYGVSRLNKAKDITEDISMKIHALNTLGYIELGKENPEKAKEYFKEADKLTSGKYK